MPGISNTALYTGTGNKPGPSADSMCGPSTAPGNPQGRLRISLATMWGRLNGSLVKMGPEKPRDVRLERPQRTWKKAVILRMVSSVGLGLQWPRS